MSARPTTLDPVAPIALRMASVARLRSTKPCAALATPTPPTTSDSKPAERQELGEAVEVATEVGLKWLSRERASHPACGKVRFA